MKVREAVKKSFMKHMEMNGRKMEGRIMGDSDRQWTGEKGHFSKYIPFVVTSAGYRNRSFCEYKTTPIVWTTY